MSAHYCRACYGCLVYCRKCKTTHCDCSWNTCKRTKDHPMTTRPKPKRPVLTKRQFQVLQLLNAGWVMDKHGKDDMGAILSGPSGQVEVVNGKTVSSLFSEWLITVGDAYSGAWVLSDKGKEFLES